jgi:hypothetical protein
VLPAAQINPERLRDVQYPRTAAQGTGRQRSGLRSGNRQLSLFPFQPDSPTAQQLCCYLYLLCGRSRKNLGNHDRFAQVIL